VLVRKAHSVAVSGDFFAFQQKAKRFFRLLEGTEFVRKETRPAQKPAPQRRYVEKKRAQKSPTPCMGVIFYFIF
jgi:hypothetical protein